MTQNQSRSGCGGFRFAKSAIRSKCSICIEGFDRAHVQPSLHNLKKVAPAAPNGGRMTLRLADGHYINWFTGKRGSTISSSIA